MGVENESGFQEPLRLETVVGGQTELESRFGREGVIVAVFISRALRLKQNGHNVSLDDVAKETGYKDVSTQEVEDILRRNGFRTFEKLGLDRQKYQKKGRVVISEDQKMFDISERPLSKWFMAVGTAEEEIQRLVREHTTVRNSTVGITGVDIGLYEPLRLETAHGGRTELEDRFGREGVIIAVFIDLALVSPEGAHPIDIALSTGIEDIYSEEVAKALRKNRFPKDTQTGNFSLGKKPLNKWMLAHGIEEDEIQKLVFNHLIERPGRLDFGLGGRSASADMPLDDPRLRGYAVAEPKETVDVWAIDDRTEEQ